ncbi:tripartite tricarboxylate transporter permease [Microbacterium sp. cf332]|uniref:tripartite tricarboxylate transporter permease n=1 Tax=Microbacterium sp. cf332 TaxID=1761804 RepID=UPI00087E5D6A|nr:tripartite tricarboxylate transporter permease [Microbacterium sp. cf332]SDQ54497.1 putative tricarboxylic transport membrane protein [Microbacterium sp. cf332]
MNTWDYLLQGLAAAATPENLLFALIGCLVGTVLGLLPGIGSTAGIAILLPITFGMEPASAIIMLAAIFYGTAYGGTITSVLLNIPGEGESAITCIDGYAMTKKGRGGVALTVAGVGSFIGGTVATIALVIAAQPLASLGLMIGPPEFFSLVVVGLALLVGLVGRSVSAGIISAGIGMVIAMVGIDPVEGLPRFTFGSEHLLDGISIVPVLVGIFGLGELLHVSAGGTVRARSPKLRELIPSGTDLRRAAPAVGRGTLIGTGIGIVPGITSTISSLLAYSTERRVGRFRRQLGTGAIEGVAAPETANNAHANAAFIPLFTLGIPASPAIAVLMGAFLQNGLVPGPLLFQTDPLLVWTVIASLFIGNALLLVLNVPLVGLWTKVLAIPFPVLAAMVYVFIFVGTYAVNRSVVDIFIMIAFGLLGLAFRRLDLPLAPLVLTLVLGPLLESALRQTLQISNGDFGFFLTRPIALVLLAVATLILVLSAIGGRRLKARAHLPVDSEV